MTEPSPNTHTNDGNKNGSQQVWGRVLVAGGTDWTRLGKKDKTAELDKRPDLLSPHILRSLSNVQVTSIHTSSSSCHCIAIASDGSAWMFGRNLSCALAVAGTDEISENAPRHVTPQMLKAQKGTLFVHAACGRAHSLLVGSNGELWSCGANTFGQCGHSTTHSEISNWKLVDGPKVGGKKETVVKAAAGVTFSLVLTDTGKVYAFGSGDHGQLGNGRTGEHITAGNKTAYDTHSDCVLVKGLQGKTIVDIAVGNQHSIVIDSEGFVYVFGYNGYCRLGLGDQQDALVAKLVPQFAGPAELTRGFKVAAGPTNSVVIDRNRMYWMAGKWKNSGEGSGGQPYTTFKFMPDIMGCKVTHVASGGVTHFALCPDDEAEEGGNMTIAWGQNAANGELGLGDDQAKSATKPTRVVPLIGIEVISVAAAQNTTFFLAKPSSKLSDLPRHPELTDVSDECTVCKTDSGEGDDPLLCEKCDTAYHPKCLNPPLHSIPDGEWFCPNCSSSPGAPIGPLPSKRSPSGPSAKPTRKERKKQVYVEEYIDEDDEEEEKESLKKKKRGREEDRDSWDEQFESDENEDEAEYVDRRGGGRKRNTGGTGRASKRRG